MGDISPPGWAGRIAVAVIRSEPPEVVLATDANVLTRVLALNYVAKTPASSLPIDAVLDIRQALLAERWDLAVAMWMTETGEAVDAYPDDTVWSDERLDHEFATIEMKAAPIFGPTIDELPAADPGQGGGVPE